MRKLVIMLWFTTVFAGASCKYELSVCAIFKNEAQFLKEWIEFHQLVGVEHFYLYDIESCDRYYNVLGPFIQKGIVTLKKWPNIARGKENQEEIWALGTQLTAYENAIKMLAAEESKWLVFLDTDEFLVPSVSDNVRDIVRLHDDQVAIVLSQEFFDASIKESFGRRKLVIEHTQRAQPPKKISRARVEKMIFKPKECEAFFWPPYTCLFKETKEPLKVSKENLRINHYLNRDMIAKKHGPAPIPYSGRALSEREISDWLDAGYLVEDQEKIVFRFLPDICEKMGVMY